MLINGDHHKVVLTVSLLHFSLPRLDLQQRIMATANSPYPRWKALIAQSIKDGMANKEKGVLYYALGTVDTSSSGGSTSASANASAVPTPHVRMVVHRGFVNEQRSSNTQTGVEPFDKRFGSNACLLTTTDVRAPKAQQIFQQQQQNAKGTSGGARGEICWWFDNKQLQFRLAGTLQLLPHKDHPSAQLFDRSGLSPPPTQEGSDSNSNSSAAGAFDWDQERKRIFDKMSPELLASFTRPNPSGPHPHGASQKSELASKPGPGEGDPEEAKNDTESPWPITLPQPGKEENDEQRKLLAEAERNFALVVMNPDTVDVVDLSRDRRSLFTFENAGEAGPNAPWCEQRLVP